MDYDKVFNYCVRWDAKSDIVFRLDAKSDIVE